MKPNVRFTQSSAPLINTLLQQGELPSNVSFNRFNGFHHRWQTVEPHHPGGMVDNSPAFQRWDNDESASSPEGTADSAAIGRTRRNCLSRPFGTYPTRTIDPALKRWAIVTCPSGTEGHSLANSPLCV